MLVCSLGNIDMVASAPTSQIPPKDKKEIPLDKYNGPCASKDKTLFPDARVFMESETKDIIVYLYDTGESVISIIDKHGSIISEMNVNSDFMPEVIIDAPDNKGIYWIVISSYYIYAEGVFTS